MSEVTVFFLLFFGIIVFAAALVAVVSRRARKWLKPRESPEDTGVSKGVGLLSSAYHMFALAGAAAGGLRFVYKAWKSAAPGSAERFGWGTLLALIVAVGLWVIVMSLDKAINRERDAVRHASGPLEGS